MRALSKGGRTGKLGSRRKIVLLHGPGTGSYRKVYLPSSWESDVNAGHNFRSSQASHSDRGGGLCSVMFVQFRSTKYNSKWLCHVRVET